MSSSSLKVKRPTYLITIILCQAHSRDELISGHYLTLTDETLTKSLAGALSREIAFAALIFQYYMQTLTLTSTLTLTINMGCFSSISRALVT